MSVGRAKYQQGGCDVYRKSLSTNRVAVMSTGRVFLETILLVSRLHSYPDDILIRSRDFIAIMLVPRLFLETSQLFCWS